MKAKIQMFVMLLMLSGLSFNAGATERSSKRQEVQQVRITEIRHRIGDIRSMDFSQLTTTDSKSLKQELKGMNKELRHMEPYMVIATGALVIVGIALIILL